MALDWTLLLELSYALGIGVLIGLERSLDATAPVEVHVDAEASVHADAEQLHADDADTDESDVDLIGVRTFAVLSLAGYASAVAADQFPLTVPVVLAGVALLILAMYRRTSEVGDGITTECAALMTCALGVLCRYEPQIAGVIGLILTAILASKRFTWETVGKMRRVELTDTLKFLAIILIVLPLLPNRALDPFGAFNPYKVGFLVVLISGIGFVGYFLTRILGAQRGLGLTGIVGGLTSSTAVTAAMALEARNQPHLRAACAVATLAANATMFVRVLVVVALLDRSLAMQLAWPIGAMSVVACGFALALWLLGSKKASPDGADDNHAEVKLKNPFSLGPAIKFAVFFVAILFVAKLAKTHFGDTGLYAASALSGLADVDAIMLSIAAQTSESALARDVGALGITIAVVSNSVVKTGISIYSGGWEFGRVVALALGGATLAGLVVAIVV